MAADGDAGDHIAGVTPCPRHPRRLVAGDDESRPVEIHLRDIGGAGLIRAHHLDRDSRSTPRLHPSENVVVWPEALVEGTVKTEPV